MFSSEQGPIFTFGRIIRQQVGDDICRFRVANRIEVQIRLNASEG